MYLFRIFCMCLLIPIADRRISLSADLSQEQFEQVNERINRLEKKVEGLDECYVRVKDIQKDVEMIQKSMRLGLVVQKEKPEVDERLDIRVDKRVKSIQEDSEMSQKDANPGSTILEEKHGIDKRPETRVDKRIEAIQKDAVISQNATNQGLTTQEPKQEVRKRLETRVERLEDAVQDLTGRAALMDTAEEIRKVTEYICPNGHSFETMSEDGKCSICGLKLKESIHFKKFKFARREGISERIATSLEEEFKKRILVGASGTGIFQQVLNDSESRSSTAEGSLDLLFIGKPLTNMTFFVDLEAIGGEGPDETLRSLSGLNDDAGSTQDEDGVDRVSLREVWLQSELFRQHIRMVVGKIDLTNYFDINAAANDETTQFITSAFVNNRTLEPPENGPGIVSIYDTRRGLFFGLGLQSADDSGSNIVNNLFAIGEVGMRSHYLFGLEGTYRLWAKINGDRNDNKGLGISIDQHLSHSLVAFARYGINETDGADIKTAWSTGLELRHPFFSRVNDSTAFAFGNTESVNGNEEQVVEFYYKFTFNNHFAITPLFQAVFNLVGSQDSDVVTLAGVRMQIDF